MEPEIYRRVYRPMRGSLYNRRRPRVSVPTLGLIDAYAGEPVVRRARKRYNEVSTSKVGTRTKSKTKTKSRQKKRVKKIKQDKCGTPCIPVCQNKILPKCMAKRRVARRTRRRRIPRLPPLGVPEHRIVRFKSTKYVSLNPAAGNGNHAVAVYKLNSIYDPFNTSTATAQPLYHDQYATMYNKYCVIGWKVQITAVSTDTNPTVISFTPMTSSSGLANWMAYRETKNTVQKILTSDMDRAWLTAKGSVKKHLLPVGGKISTDDTLCASMDANPERILHGHFVVAAMDDTTDIAAVNCIVTLTQIVKLYAPVVPARS